MKKLITIALSGGIDSTVCALILKKKKKYNLVLVFMKNWETLGKKTICTSRVNFLIVKKISKQLKIKQKKINFSIEYWNNVFINFIHQIEQGLTPNPDILCNKEIKFKTFLLYTLKSLKTNFVATGHYAKIKSINNKKVLYMAHDKKKDQTYFLHVLQQNQLKYIIFPLESSFKKKIRLYAKKNNLENYNKKDSTGICFIENKNFTQFLHTYVKKKKGYFTDEKGILIKQHNKLPFYTIGQRKGLHIGGNKNYKKKPWFVLKKFTKLKHITLTQTNKKLINTTSIYIINTNLILKKKVLINTQVTSKIRYQQKEQKSKVYHKKNTQMFFHFYKKQKFTTKGQYLVFYYEKICLGGGIIF